MTNPKDSSVIARQNAGNVVNIGDYTFAQDLTDSGKESLRFYFQTAFKHKTENTKRAYTSDLKAYVRYCQCNHPGEDLFLVDEVAMRDRINAYIDNMIEVQEYKKATIERRLNLLRLLLSVMKVPNPFNNKGYADYFNDRISQPGLLVPQDQATPFKESDLLAVNKKGYVDTLGLRNLTLLNVAFDSLLRASELARIEWKHIDENLKTVFIPYTKTNRGQDKDYRSLSGTTLRYLEELRSVTPVDARYVFSPMLNTEIFNEQSILSGNAKPLNYTNILKGLLSAMSWGGFESSLYSAHSTRVGAALSMREKGISLEAIMEAGGWKSIDMVRRYLKAIETRYSGASQLAAMSGR
ncbi:hypothetical protein C9975_03065 [Thalassospira xiamenensis]|nr:hypothetical protein C9975_03065 [Thalassospira xiamenensis]